MFSADTRTTVQTAGVVGGARVVGVWVQQLTEACGPGMPDPYGEFKDIWAAVVKESLRRCGATSL